MKEEEREIMHRIHVSGFWERFEKAVMLRGSAEDILSYIDFNIVVENKRLNRYLQKYKPELYIDHEIKVNEIRGIIKELLSRKELALAALNNEFLHSFQWQGSAKQLKNLFENLMFGNFLPADSKYEIFEYFFQQNELSNNCSKIVWLKRSKNKQLNKKSIFDLIDVLIQDKFLDNILYSNKSKLCKIMELSFTDEVETILKFSQSNMVNTSKGYSSERKELEELVSRL